MKKPGVIKRTVKSVADVPTLLDTEFLTASWYSIRNMIGKLFTPKSGGYQESFEEALVRLQLTEEDLKHRIREFGRLAFIFVSMAILSFIYTIYLCATEGGWGVILGFVITLFLLTRAFYFHFWLFQIKNRKLGCTIKEWLNSTVTGVS